MPNSRWLKSTLPYRRDICEDGSSGVGGSGGDGGSIGARLNKENDFRFFLLYTSSNFVLVVEC